MKLELKRSRKKPRVFDGHPWVFDNELAEPPTPEMNGRAVPLFSDRGRLLGTGLVSTASKIAWRKISASEVEWNPAFIQQRLSEAIFKREEEPCRRLVWSEADRLPGLIVDQFDPYLVLQALTPGIEAVLDPVLECLESQFNPKDILLRNDAPSRSKEGLAREVTTRGGTDSLPGFWADIYGLQYWLDLNAGMKTGFYLDQRQEHFKVATFAEDWRVLDCFCNQGAFALNAARAGAREVIGLDSSGEAVATARKNAARNQLEVEFQETNVFDYLAASHSETFDLIVLDPPSFAPNRRALVGARRGYKELHLRAFQRLHPGGILATYCCSHHIGREDFLGIIRSAALDAGRQVQVLYPTSQPLDHPVDLHFPESEYLKGFILRVEG